MKLLVPAAAFLILSSPPAPADTSWMNRANIPKSGAIPPIPPSRLQYDISWNGKIKAGILDIHFGKKDKQHPNHYVATGHGTSTGWARALYPATVDYTALLRKSDCRPVQFWGFENERRETVEYFFRFSPSGATGTRTTTDKNTKISKTDSYSFHYPNTLELFSGLLQTRSMPLRNGDRILMPFHPVSKPYLTDIKVLGREKHLGRNCIKLNVRLQKIGRDMKLKPYKKLKTSTVWISDDPWRVPVEVRAKVYIGDIRVTLTRHDRL